MSKVDEDEINLNDSFSRMNTSKLSDEYDPLVAVFSSSVTASTASNDEDDNVDDSDEWEKHSIEKRRNRTLTPTRTQAMNMTFSPRVIKKDLFRGLRNLPFSRSNSPEDKQPRLETSIRSQNHLDKISSEDTQKLMESTPIEEPATDKEVVDQLQAALERFTLTSPIAMPQSKPRSIYDLKEKVNDDDTRMSSLPVEMPMSAKLILEANMNEIKTWAMLVKRETLKIKQINQEEITTTTTTTTDMPIKSSDTTSDADKELIGKLQAEIQAYKDREKKYVNQITNIVDQNEQFQLIADEFEKIFKQFVVEKDANEAKLRKEIVDLTKERDQLQEDVVGIEQSFDNLHKRFENLKSKVNVFKTNEDNLQKVIESYKQQLEREKLKYTTLKKHAEEKLDVANVEIEKLRKNTGIEIQSLKAELKRSEIKINSMELNIQQKDQENSQLTNLLEDLLNKVKPNNAAY